MNHSGRFNMCVSRWACAFSSIFLSWAAMANDASIVSRDTATEFSAHKATVLLFLYADCPIANGYAPEIARIAKKYTQEGVAFFRVYPEPDITQAAVLEHGQEFSLPMDAVLDPELALVKQTGARVAPTAVVYDASGARRYIGRIDNRYVDLGRLRAHVTKTDLRDALDAVLAGKEVSTKETQAIGCFLPKPKEPDAAPATEQK
jgi:hypothetical protein